MNTSKKSLVLSKCQFQTLLRELDKIFDKIILIDVLLGKSVKITSSIIDHMSFLQHDTLWKHHDMSVESACVQAFRHRSKIVHFDYQPQRIYYAISQYVEVEGHGICSRI